MEKEFVPYKQALALKELGFDEPCAACYGSYTHKTSELFLNINNPVNIETLVREKTGFNRPTFYVKSPTFSHVFRWFREKYNLHHSISILQRSCRYHFKIRTIECESDLKPFGDNKIIFEDGPRKKYEDIELDCLKKLIEIVTNKN